MRSWISKLLEDPALRGMGHGQRPEDLNLGLGWLYYALGRIVRPARAVVIGSHRGFVPMVIGRALQDNLEAGELIFIDPSLVDEFWTEPDRLDAYFRAHGVDTVLHHRATTQEFVETDAYRELGPIGLLFVDGYHTEEQARFDHEAFRHLLDPGGFTLFHDSMVVRDDRVYGAEAAYEMRVKYYIDSLRKDPTLQVLDLPFGVSGLTLVRQIDPDAPDPRREWIEGTP